jgi:transcriptional regulator with XRE-family HTH domain
MVDLTISERIRALCKPAYPQDDLAAAAQISVDVIRKLEQGLRHTASIGTLQRIARAVDVNLAATVIVTMQGLGGAARSG